MYIGVGTISNWDPEHEWCQLNNLCNRLFAYMYAYGNVIVCTRIAGYGRDP